MGCYPSTPNAVYFHFQLRREISKFLRHYGLLPTRGKTASSDCYWDFFSPHLSAVVTDCDFRQTNLIVFVVLIFFSCFSHNPLQSRCNFCRSVCADMHWRVNIPLPPFFLSSFKGKKWTSFPLMTYSQTDTKAFILHDFYRIFIFRLICVLFWNTSIWFTFLGFISLGTLSQGL